jgi:hypothetical protein
VCKNFGIFQFFIWLSPKIAHNISRCSFIYSRGEEDETGTISSDIWHEELG